MFWIVLREDVANRWVRVWEGVADDEDDAIRKAIDANHARHVIASYAAVESQKVFNWTPPTDGGTLEVAEGVA